MMHWNHTYINRQKIHIRDEPFECDKCDKRISLEVTFLDHQRIHNSENPFKCHLCDVRFCTTEVSSNSPKNTQLRKAILM